MIDLDFSDEEKQEIVKEFGGSVELIDSLVNIAESVFSDEYMEKLLFEYSEEILRDSYIELVCDCVATYDRQVTFGGKSDITMISSMQIFSERLAYRFNKERLTIKKVCNKILRERCSDEEYETYRKSERRDRLN